MTPFDWKLIGGVLLLAALFAFVHWYDTGERKIGAQECTISNQTQQIATTAAVAASVAAETDRNTGLSKQLEVDKLHTQVTYALIEAQAASDVQREVYSHVCLDADGLRHINAALLPASDAASGSDR